MPPAPRVRPGVSYDRGRASACRLPARERGCLVFHLALSSQRTNPGRPGACCTARAGPPAGRRCPPAMPCASREGFASGARLASRPSSSGSVLSSSSSSISPWRRVCRPTSGPRSDQTCGAASRRQTGGAWPHAQAAAAREATIREGAAVPWPPHAC